MLGTIINTCTIIAGTTFGVVMQKRMNEKYQKVLFNALGLCCLVLGVNTALTNLNKSEYPVMFIICLAIGGLIGTKIKFAARVERISANSKGAAQGLTTGILLYCIGSFSIVGPFLSALSPSAGWMFHEQANTFLYTNATLDLVTSAVLAASYGWIMILAAPVLFLWQGMLYSIAYIFGTAMPETMQTELSLIGGILIISSGLSILEIKDCKTINLLPSLILPIILYLFASLFK